MPCGKQHLVGGSVLAVLWLGGCSSGPAGPSEPQAHSRFVFTVASYGESSSDGSSRYVAIIRNAGAYADTARFTVMLRAVNDDGPAWTGRGSARDIDPGETVQVEMVGDSPPPLSRINDVEYTAERG